MDTFNKSIYGVIVNSDVRPAKLGRWSTGENSAVSDFHPTGKMNEINMNRI